MTEQIITDLMRQRWEIAKAVTIGLNYSYKDRDALIKEYNHQLDRIDALIAKLVTPS